MRALNGGLRVLICDVLVRELEEYIKLFGTSEEAGRCHSPMIPSVHFFCIHYVCVYTGQLEFAVQRFKWLRQKLHVYTQSYVAVFPAKWFVFEYIERILDKTVFRCVARCLARTFCTRTRSHMKQLLKSMESAATSVKAGPFTHAFKKACEFETELDAKLLVTSSGLGISDGFSATGDEDSESDRIRRRHMRRSQTSGSGAGDVGPAHDSIDITSFGTVSLHVLPSSLMFITAGSTG